MSRLHPSHRTVNLWIRDFPELHFDGIELYCRSCEKKISWKIKSNVMKHVFSDNHKKCVSGTSDSDNQMKFNLDLVEMMVGCNIPWKKLQTPLFRHFLQKCISGHYSNVQVPAESTIRKNYFKTTCDGIKQKFSSELDDKCIWLNMDETTDASGSKIANVLVGGLDENCSMRGHLIKSKTLESVESNTVVDLVHSSLEVLWGEKYMKNRDKVLLFISDPTPYMKSAGMILKETYPNVLHITCLAHDLHNVAKTIKRCYPNVDELISSIKNVFLNAPASIPSLQETIPDTPTLSETTSTRWGTWIEAASYYYSNFDDIKSEILQLNPDDGIFSHAQEAFDHPTIQQDLAYIHGNFSRIPSVIHELERIPTISTVSAMNIVFDLRHYIFKLLGDTAERVKQKFDAVLKNNPGFCTMSRVVDLLGGKEVDFSEEGLNVPSLERYTYFKYAPLASVDVAQYFSQYKWIFDDKRHNVTPENLEQISIIYFNSQHS